MGSELLQIQVVGGDGLERDVIVTAAMPLFHLHRVLQFCINPHQSDDTIAGQVRYSRQCLLFKSVQMHSCWLDWDTR